MKQILGWILMVAFMAGATAVSAAPYIATNITVGTFSGAVLADPASGIIYLCGGPILNNAAGPKPPFGCVSIGTMPKDTSQSVNIYVQDLLASGTQYTFESPFKGGNALYKYVTVVNLSTGAMAYCQAGYTQTAQGIYNGPWGNCSNALL